jgi:hypothetical protein
LVAAAAAVVSGLVVRAVAVVVLHSQVEPSTYLQIHPLLLVLVVLVVLVVLMEQMVRPV